MKKIGKIKKVDLRSYWKNEASDFTNWLAEKENLSFLSSEIGIEIKLIETEGGIGSFSADILAEEENTGRRIVIENQLEKTNHDHLGKIITYASGYDSEIIIWITKEVREEHRQAVDWLNENTDEKINFFIVKLELWQIENSPIAPKFQIISKPNDWAKTIKKSANRSEPTETQLSQLNFWNEFKNYAQSKNSKLRLRRTSPQHWYDISIGVQECHISLTINTMEDLLGCEIYIPDSKELFYELRKKKDKIEKELEGKLEWMELPGRKASRIRIKRDIAPNTIDNPDKHKEYFEWLVSKSEKFQKVFIKYVKKIRKENNNS
jgi:hypothetical protein